LARNVGGDNKEVAAGSTASTITGDREGETFEEGRSSIVSTQRGDRAEGEGAGVGEGDNEMKVFSTVVVARTRAEIREGKSSKRWLNFKGPAGSNSTIFSSVEEGGGRGGRGGRGLGEVGALPRGERGGETVCSRGESGVRGDREGDCNFRAETEAREVEESVVEVSGGKEEASNRGTSETTATAPEMTSEVGVGSEGIGEDEALARVEDVVGVTTVPGPEARGVVGTAVTGMEGRAEAVGGVEAAVEAGT
jgi:hypothetical protein